MRQQTTKKRRAKAVRAAPSSPHAAPAEGAISVRPWWGGQSTVACLVLAAITLLAFAQVRHFGFVDYDDLDYVAANPHIAQGLTWDAVRWALTSGYFANWHPLTWISHMVDVQLFGLNAGAHHTVNVLFHLANTLLLFGILQRMTGAVGRSALVAALFAVHPMHVESVAWVSERKDVLSTCCWLLTMWVYLAYVRQPDWRRYALVVLGLTLGLMAKPMVVTLPFVLLLLDLWPLRRVVLGQSPRAVWLRLVYEKLPLMALVAASSVITYLVQRTAGAVESLNVLPLSVRLANAILAYWSYVSKLVWPTRLALLYTYEKSLDVAVVAAVLAGLIAISIAALRTIRSRPYLLVGWLWFLGTLVPVIGIVQVGKQPMADRYTYVPSIGLFVMVVWGAADVLQRVRAPQGLATALSVAVVAIFAVVARLQVELWQSGIVLWEHTIAVTQDNYLAENNLGWDLALAGRPAEAIPHYQESLRLSPRFVGGYTNLALALVAANRYDEAIVQYGEALKIAPQHYLAHGNLGFALSHQGRLDEAVSHFTEAIRLKEDYVEAHNGLGLALARKGDVAGAIREYNEAIRFMPKFAEAHNNLGAALAGQGKLDEAIAQFAEALRLKPAFVDAHNNYGVALSTEGKIDEAIAQFAEAVRLDPNHAKAHYGLGLALQRQGRTAEAEREFTEVLRIRPTDDDARRALDGLKQHGQ